MHRHILLATDGSRLSKRSAKEATTLARSLGAQLTAVHVVPARFGFMVNSKTRVELRNAARTGGERYLDEVEALARSANVRCNRLLFRNDDPWRAIIRAARTERCDLIASRSFFSGARRTKCWPTRKYLYLVCR